MISGNRPSLPWPCRQSSQSFGVIWWLMLLLIACCYQIQDRKWTKDDGTPSSSLTAESFEPTSHRVCRLYYSQSGQFLLPITNFLSDVSITIPTRMRYDSLWYVDQLNFMMGKLEALAQFEQFSWINSDGQLLFLFGLSGLHRNEWGTATGKFTM